MGSGADTYVSVPLDPFPTTDSLQHQTPAVRVVHYLIEFLEQENCETLPRDPTIAC